MNISSDKYEVEYASGGPGLMATVLSFGTILVLNEMLKSATGTNDGIYCKVTDKETGESVEEWGQDIHEAEKKAFKGLMRKVNGDRFELSFSPEGIDIIETIATLGINILVHELLGWDSGWYCSVKDTKTGIEEAGYGNTKFDAMVSAHKNIKQKVDEKEAEERQQKIKDDEERRQRIKDDERKRRQRIKDDERKRRQRIKDDERKRRDEIDRLYPKPQPNYPTTESSPEGCAIKLGLIVALITVVVIALVYVLMFAVALIALTAPVVILVGHFIRSKRYIPFASKFTDNYTDENPMHSSPWSAGISALLSGVLVWGVWKNVAIQGITQELGGVSLQNYIGYQWC